MSWIFFVAAAVAGGFNMLQSGTNSTLKRALDAPFWSLATVSGVTFFASLAVVLVREEPLPSWEQIRAAPAWAWSGGLCGMVYVLTMILTADKIGAAAFTGITLTAGILLSVALDHFGWIGFEEHPAGWARLLGAALMVAGVTLVTRG